MKVFEYDVDPATVQLYFPTSIDISQVYGYIKTMPEFIFAEDI